MNSGSQSCEIGFGFQYDTKASIWNHESKKYYFQIQDRPHRALYYILPSLIAAVIFNIPRCSEPMIFQHAQCTFLLKVFLSEICWIPVHVTLQHKLLIANIDNIFSDDNFQIFWHRVEDQVSGLRGLQLWQDGQVCWRSSEKI